MSKAARKAKTPRAEPNTAAAPSRPAANKGPKRKHSGDDHLVSKRLAEKSAKKSEPVLDSSMARECAEFFSDHAVGNRQYAVDPDSLGPPGGGWRAREQFDAHVNKLMESFSSSRTVNPNVKAVLACNSTFAFYQANPECDVADLLAHFEQQNPDKLPETFAGDHTREAVTRLKAAFPEDPLW